MGMTKCKSTWQCNNLDGLGEHLICRVSFFFKFQFNLSAHQARKCGKNF